MAAVRRAPLGFGEIRKGHVLEMTTLGIAVLVVPGFRELVGVVLSESSRFR